MGTSPKVCYSESGLTRRVRWGWGMPTSDSQVQWQRQGGYRAPTGLTRPGADLLNRYLLGQLAEPPETAISTPLQQAATLQQAGVPAMQSAYGIGGGVADRLRGQNAIAGQPAPGSLLPSSMQGGAPQFGLQSRESFGIPDRASYMPEGFTPSPEDILNLVNPPRPQDKQLANLARRENRVETRIGRRQAEGKSTAKAERKLDRVQTRTEARKAALDR